MRKPKMKRRGGVDLVIAFGGPPAQKKRRPEMEDEMEMEEMDDEMDVDSMKQERMDLLEERIARLESMLSEEEGEEEEGDEDEEDWRYA